MGAFPLDRDEPAAGDQQHNLSITHDLRDGSFFSNVGLASE
jgi:hypothetical protein